MIFLKEKLIRWPAGCLIFLLLLVGTASVSCRRHEKINKLIITKQDSIKRELVIERAFKTIREAEKSIFTGDLVTRTGNDFTSQSLRKLNRRNQTYSHCGIASIENDSLFIYHAMGGEWNPDEKLRRDPFILFAEPYSNQGIGIFHFDLDEVTKNQLNKVVKEYYRQGLMFDMKFDLITDDRMYCAEFIYKSFIKASNNKMAFNKSRLGNFIFMGVDDIFMQPLCSIKKQIVYN
jgi:Permuted papain-like amidase enzyme, YaeF/YiiX, C92 family